MRTIGILLFIVGVAFLFISCNMNTTVGGYHNIGLISDRQNHTIVAAALTIIGLLIFLLTQRTSTQGKKSTKCPFCAEEIAIEAVLCKHCHSTVPNNHQEPENKPAPQLVRTALNSLITAEIKTTKQLDQIKAIAATEIYKIKKHFDKETLTESHNNIIQLETIINTENQNSYTITIRYNTTKNYKPLIAATVVLFVAYALNPQAHLLLYGALLSLAATSGSFISEKIAYNKLKSAIENIKSCAEI